MKHYDIHSLQGAIQAKEDGNIKVWIYDFLQNGMTPNNSLIDGLEKVETRTYLGPVLFALTKFKRSVGPEANMRYQIETISWQKKISLLKQKIKDGWKPQPLITAGNVDEPFLLHDGNHRYEALKQTNINKYWVIFHFENEHEKKILKKSICRIPKIGSKKLLYI